MVVGFHFHQDMRGLLMEVIAPCFAIGEEAAHLRTFHHRGVVFIGRQHVVRRLLHGVFDHFEQRLWLLFAVNNPVGIENLVAAVLRVRLREHVEFNVVRVTVELNERILQVVDFVFCQRQAETQVGVNQRLTALSQQVHALYRCRLMVGEKLLRVIKRGKYALHHAVVQFSRNRLPLRVAQGRGFHVVRYAALQTVNLAQATVVGDVGGFGRPGGDGARTRRRKDQFAGWRMAAEAWAILEQAFQLYALLCIQGGIQVSKMDILSVNIAYRKVGRLKTCQQFGNTEGRQCRRTTQNFHHKSLVFEAPGRFQCAQGGKTGVIIENPERRRNRLRRNKIDEEI